MVLDEAEVADDTMVSVLNPAALIDNAPDIPLFFCCAGERLCRAPHIDYKMDHRCQVCDSYVHVFCVGVRDENKMTCAKCSSGSYRDSFDPPAPTFGQAAALAKYWNERKIPSNTADSPIQDNSAAVAQTGEAPQENEQSESVASATTVTVCTATTEASEPQAVTQTTDPSVPQAVPQVNRKRKRILVGQRVSGKLGELVDNPRGHGRRVRQRIYGVVLKTCGHNKYSVKFDDGSVQEHHSNSLKLEKETTAIPVAEVEDGKEGEDDVVADVINDVGEEAADDDDDSNHHVEEGAITDTVNIGDINASADTIKEDYHQKLARAREKVGKLLGKEVTVNRNKGKDSITWTVVKEHHSDNPAEVEKQRRFNQRSIGMKGLDQLLVEENFVDPSVASSDGISRSNFFHRPSNSSTCTIFAKMLFRMLYVDWEDKLEIMNEAIREGNVNNTGRDVRKFSRSEFITGHALMIAAASYEIKGARLWRQGERINETTEDDWDSIVQCPGFDDYMKLYRFKQFRTFFPKIFENKRLKDADLWWPFSGAVDEFNRIRKVSSLSPYFIFTMQ